MGKKIIVAGAGHGGIAVAGLLAKEGFDVTVYERGAEGTLGYDWTDIFAPNALGIAGMDMPAEDKYCFKENMTFYSTDMKTALRQDVKPEELEIKMERKDIYAHFIEYATDCGAKFVYDCNIESPILFGNRVVGIKTSKGDFYADLVIDAAGIDSPLRTKLPSMCAIEKNVGDFGQFYVYRAFYNKGSEEEVKDKYKVCLLPQGKLGVAWVAAEEEYTDLLIGRFEPLDEQEAQASADFLRAENPVLGTEVKRGGQFVKIPVRQPLSIMVCDGYAAIGDSAFMTVPIIGSGIANSLKAAKALAETVIEDKNGAYSADTLWQYQVRYYRRLGAGLAVLACVKLLLTELKPEELDFIFANGILTAQDMTIGANSVSLSSMMGGASPAELISKAQAVVKDPVLLKKIINTGIRIGKVAAATAVMPKTWNRNQVLRWAKQYKICFQI